MRSDPRQLLRWQQHRSANFVFSFLQDSPAEKNVTAVADRAEAVRDTAIKALGLSSSPPREKTQVYLSDVPDDGRRREGGTRAMGGQRVIAVYLSEAQSEELERAVVEMLLTSEMGVDADRAAMIVDGVLGHVAQQIGGSGAPELDAALARLQGEGRSMSLRDALHGPTPEGRTLYRRIVTSFVSFLLVNGGPEKFERFARAFDPAAPDAASRAAYGRTFGALEDAWRENLERTGSAVPGTVVTSGGAFGAFGFLRRAFVYLSPYWWQQGLILLASLIGAGFTVLLARAFGWVIAGLGREDYTYVLAVVLGVVVLYFVQAPATIGRQYLVARVGARVMNDMRVKLFEHLQRLSTNFYSRTRPGDIMSRFASDLGAVEAALTQMLPMLVTLAVTFAASLITLFFLQGFLALVIVALLPIFFVIPARLGRKAVGLTHEQQRARATVASSLQESIGAQQLIKAYGLQRETLGKFRGNLDDLGRVSSRAGFFTALPGLTATLSVAFVQVVALAGGSYLVSRDALTVADMSTFQLLVLGVTGPLTALTGVMQMLLQAAAGMQRVEEFLNEVPQIQDARDAVELGRFSREIGFKNVNFSYTGEQVNLRDVSLAIPAGQSVAFVGPSGSGKSTVLNLILRFYDPTTGVVSVDGHDLREVTQASLRRQIGAVFQETFLYNTSVRENIRLGKPDATDYEVEQAGKAAEIHDFVMTLPQGYDTPVGERGGRLSGGQKQRIAIARAILYDPAILVLDEPTSALDPTTEAAINATLEKLMKGRTVILVTHRLTSVRNMDRVVVLERGRVVEQGDHAELLAAGGLYHRLWTQQNGPDGRQESPGASRLRMVPFFRGLPPPALEALAKHLVRENHDEGRTIFAAGDPANGMYLVDRGEVEIRATDPAGQERSVAVLRDGQPFGDAALVGNPRRPVTAIAKSPTVLLHLDGNKFEELLGTVPGLREGFERGVEERRQAAAAMRGGPPPGARRPGP